MKQFFLPKLFKVQPNPVFFFINVSKKLIILFKNINYEKIQIVEFFKNYFREFVPTIVNKEVKLLNFSDNFFFFTQKLLQENWK